MTLSANIKIHYYLHADAPPMYQRRWLDVIKMLSDQQEQIILLEEWKLNMKLATNKSLPILGRLEGGLGGDSNTKNKQIRFTEPYYYVPYKISLFKPIILNVNTSHDGRDVWTLSEVDDVKQAFGKVLARKLEEYCFDSLIIIDT